MVIDQGSHNGITNYRRSKTMNVPAVEDLSNYNPVEDPAFMQLLKDWEKAQRAAAKAVDEERKLRDEVAKCAFVNPKEGVNKLKLLHGYQAGNGLQGQPDHRPCRPSAVFGHPGRYGCGPGPADP
ncbi:hypothetical protein [Stenotrophomonas phage CM2]